MQTVSSTLELLDHIIVESLADAPPKRFVDQYYSLSLSL
jgi:hypothetical protein